MAAGLICLVLPPFAHAQLSRLEQQAFQQAAALAEPSIVRIETVGGLDRVGEILTGTGPTTGVVVGEDGYIITSSFNFVSKPASVLVTLPDGRPFAAEIVAADTSRMLTLLKIEQGGLTPIKAAPKEEFRVGQWAIALGRTYDNAFPSLSVGIVSAIGRVWGRAVQTDAKVSPVNYGGALVDIEGRGIGILAPLSPQDTGETAGVEWYDSGIGFAIPIEDVYAVLDRLKAGETLKTGLMGITLTDRTPTAGEAKIDRVRPASPADEAGLQSGDVVIEADGQPVERSPELLQILGTKYADEKVAIAVRRGDETIRTEVTLAGELQAYESGFLGVLPVREPADAERDGVAIREVLFDSPAAKAGLQPRDVILKVSGQPVAAASELLDTISRLRPGETAALTYQREGEKEKEQSAEVELSSIPNTVPADLATTAIPAYTPPEGEMLPPTGRFNDALPGDQGGFWAYVPDQYNPDYEYGLVVWLHPGGDAMEAAMLRQWQTHCDRRGLILVGPRAADISGWTPDEADFIKGVVERMRERYRIDPARIVIHGHADGGQFAYLAAFKYREIFRGIATSSAPLRMNPPENDPDFRTQFYLTCGSEDPLAEGIVRVVEALRMLKFPVTFTEVDGADANYPGEATIDEIARWIDSLDRI